MANEYTHYIKGTFNILKNHFHLLLIPSILTTGLYISQLEAKDSKFLLFWIFIFSIFIILPLIYGQYIEIILCGKITSWGTVFNSYWLRFLIVTVLVKIPTFLCILLFIQFGEIKNAISLLTEIFSIYIFPLVFLNKEIINSIKLGIKCLIGNIKFSAPLIIITVITYFLPELNLVSFKLINSKFFLYIFYFIFILINVSIDFIIFITASLILKDKLLLIKDHE